jgi:hypothetical protein
MLVVIAIISILLVAVLPGFNSINAGRGIARAVSEVGFGNTSNSDGNSELRSGAVISIDGSSSAVAANLRPVSKLLKLPNILMTNHTDLTSVVKSAADISLQTNTDFVITLSNHCLLEGQVRQPCLR